VPNTEAVKRALRGLALGDPHRSAGDDGPDREPPAGTECGHGHGVSDVAAGRTAGVDTLLRRGAAALVDVEAAAAFRLAGGVSRLETAASDAERRGADATARRCRRVADAFDAYRRVARPSRVSGAPRACRSPRAETVSPAPADDGTASDPGSTVDHFRPAHGTSLSDDGQNGDR
jgi:hypothetical protein